MGTENTLIEMSEPLLVEPQNNDFEEIPEWREQITTRGLAVSALLGTLFSIITHKLVLTVGIVPSLNIAAGLLGFFFVKSWTGVLSRIGFSVAPFTKQENTVIQTCVVACYGLACSGGFGTYLIAMDERTYKLIGTDYPGNRAEDVINPGLAWMIGFLFVVSFIGLFSLLLLCKVMILDYKLTTYPSGTITAMLINSFHTNTGAELAGKQVRYLGKYLGISFSGSCFKWFFSGIGDSCGFDNFPTLGLELYKNTNYIMGVSLPFITQHAGNWYPADLVLGDGLYNLIKIVSVTIKEICNKSTKQINLAVIKEVTDSEDSKLLAEERREEVFLKDRIPTWLVASGYVGLAAISTATIPMIFPPLNWYLVLGAYIVAPALAFCNSYGTGLTDWNLSGTYGKLGLFLFASLVGNNGGVIVGLAASGVMMSIVSTAADLMQDFKTGYLTLSSARSMFVSQLVGTAMGCVIVPLTFWLFWNAFDIGSPDSPYKAPFAVIFRELAILGVQGFSELPKRCLPICCAFFVAAFLVNLLRDVVPRKISQFIPIPMVMAAPFYTVAYFAVDMFVGTVILFIWERINRKDSEDCAGAVASGLICGDGIWTNPSAALSIFSINPPICLSFKPTSG